MNESEFFPFTISSEQQTFVLGGTGESYTFLKRDLKQVLLREVKGTFQ